MNLSGTENNGFIIWVGFIHKNLNPFGFALLATLDDYIYTPDDYIIEGEVEEGRLYEEANFNKIIEIKEREAKRVQIFMDEANFSLS
jgi:hypothetical protein